MGTIKVDTVTGLADPNKVSLSSGATLQVDEIVNVSGDKDSGINLATNDIVAIKIAGSEKARINSSGNLLVGTTNSDIRGSSSDEGLVYRAGASLDVSMDGGNAMNINRLSSDGALMELRKDGENLGSIGMVKTSGGGRPYLAADTHSIYVNGGNANVNPGTATGSDNDNSIDLGGSAARWDDVFATNGTIQTSDQNEKQDIASLTTKELNVAKKLCTLFKTFRWKDKVEEKGDKARTHSGIVAQEVQSAFSAEGLDATKYGLFTSDTWWSKEIKVDAVKADAERGIEARDAYTYVDNTKEKTDGYTEKTRLGVRYPELFSFIFSSIEARLTALESK